ncbi:response regulator transcription factor [Allokutzneria oryzae]|uniref:Response regulator n=1 Tax=Allokutzneria oryzae TaxID=1378989 RepID=A0ABV5ZYK2_9PSEU
MIKVVLADDDPLVRQGIRAILASADDIDVVADTADGNQAVQEVLRHNASIALLDIRMPVLDGIGAVRRLAELAPRTRSIILTTFGDDDNIRRALSSGANGFLLKTTAPGELVDAVRTVHEGGAHLSPAVTSRVVALLGRDNAESKLLAAQRVGALAPREQEVLGLVARGLSNAEVGRRAHLSEATVKAYVSRIMTKLDCANRVQIALLAKEAGL